MLRFCLASLAGCTAFLPLLGAAVAQSPLINAACQSLAKQYTDSLYWPDSSMYINETQSFWSKSTILEPYCVFSPHDASQVATALALFKSTQTQFSIRGNGHMPVKGAASTNQGVLLVLTRMKGISLNADKSVVSIGPGLSWFEVYNWIESSGRAVLGGRYAPVGVSGFLLGGGISFHSGQYGWGANSVKNYELVTANGKILEVNQASYPDLFWALKGGSANFGVVTRFDVRTHPGGDVYAGAVRYDPSLTSEFSGALENFVSPGGGIDDPESAILPNIAIDPVSGAMAAEAYIFTDGNQTATFNNFTSLKTVTNTAKTRPFNDFVGESVSSGDRSSRNAFYATALKASGQSVQLINATISANVKSMLGNTSCAAVVMSIQPISTSWLKAARQAGGDALDLDPADGNFIAMNLVLQWRSEADDARIAQFARDMLSQLDQASKNAGLYYPFVYINDSGSGENPFALYGKGKSLAKMRAIRQKYDPTGVFQYLQPGGFKLGM